jgi:biotin carboxyl carrier protein
VLIYAGPDGLHSLGTDDELPKDLQPLHAVAKARRAIATTHHALVPIATGTETIAVVQLTRNQHQQPYSLVEHVFMAAVARESAGIMHHLVVQHLQRRTEAEADKRSLYRPEALESHRRRGHEGVIAELSPGWVRRTYHVLVAIMAVALAFSFFIKVPTYSTGNGVVVFKGTPVTAQAPGTVESVYVQPGQQVHKGDLLVKLASAKEDADYAQAKSELEAAEQQYLFDASDETVRKQLVTAQAAARRAEAAIEQRSVRAPKDGTASDLRVHPGMGVQFSDLILTVVEPGTEPEVWALLPGSDRPRVHNGMRLQVELTGYTKTRESATIYEVGRDVIPSSEARRTIGADAEVLHLAQDGNYVLVKATLPGRTFHAEHRTYQYHQGLPAKTEVRVESKRFLITLIPSLEKYVE